MDSSLNQITTEPFFFEKSLKKLYGCHHRPTIGMGYKPFVVICSPIGQEYIRSHRALYNLANILAREGYDVLRFDYSGCGDSEGDFIEGDLAQWEEDVKAAVEEMRFRCSNTETILIGLRVGGTLAARAAIKDRVITKLVLWEPVINGQAYLNEIRMMQSEFVEWLRPRNQNLFTNTDGQEEILGFIMNKRLISEIEEINNSNFEISQYCEKMILLNDREENQDQSVQQLIEKTDRFHVVYCNEIKLWNEQLFKRITPVASLKEIVTWINKE